MKIYFTAALQEIPKSHLKYYKSIVKVLKEMGHRVISGHILGRTERRLRVASGEERLSIHRKTLAWKHQADITVAEVSYQSLSVGQEISYALSNNKPVIALHLKNKHPEILIAVGTDYIHIVEYSLESLKTTLEDYIEYAKDAADTRFNFFVSSNIDSFLNWVSKEKKLPRAVYLRQLIEDDLRRNSKYLKQVGIASQQKKQ